MGVVSHNGFQSQPRGLVFLMLDLRTGVPNVVLKQLFFFRKDSQAHDVRSPRDVLFWVTCRACESRLDCFSSPATHLRVCCWLLFFFFFFFFIFFIVEESFCILQVFLWENCSTSTYNFGVFVGEGELRIFLLHHLNPVFYKSLFSYSLLLYISFLQLRPFESL